MNQKADTSMEKSSKTTLGCGTLIIIAIIVMIFSGNSDKSEMKKLQNKIDDLDRKIDAVRGDIERSRYAAPQFFRVEQKLDDISDRLDRLERAPQVIPANP